MDENAPLDRSLRELVAKHGLAALLDAIANEFPQYSIAAHEIAESATRDAEMLIGKSRR